MACPLAGRMAFATRQVLCVVLQGPIPQLQNAQALPLLRAFVVAQKVNGRQHFRFEAGDWANADPATGLPPDKGKHLLTAINTGRYHALEIHVTVALLHWQGVGKRQTGHASPAASEPDISVLSVVLRANC